MSIRTYPGCPPKCPVVFPPRCPVVFPPGCPLVTPPGCPLVFPQRFPPRVLVCFLQGVLFCLLQGVLLCFLQGVLQGVLWFFLQGVLWCFLQWNYRVSSCASSRVFFRVPSSVNSAECPLGCPLCFSSCTQVIIQRTPLPLTRPFFYFC